jgi:hypothetical protein
MVVVAVMVMMPVMMMVMMRMVVVVMGDVVVMVPSGIDDIRFGIKLGRTVPIRTGISFRNIANWTDRANWEGINRPRSTDAIRTGSLIARNCVVALITLKLA